MFVFVLLLSLSRELCWVELVWRLNAVFKKRTKTAQFKNTSNTFCLHNGKKTFKNQNSNTKESTKTPIWIFLGMTVDVKNSQQEGTKRPKLPCLPLNKIWVQLIFFFRKFLVCHQLHRACADEPNSYQSFPLRAQTEQLWILMSQHRRLLEVCASHCVLPCSKQCKKQICNNQN